MRHRATYGPMWPARTRLGAPDPVDPVDRYTLGHGALGFVLGLWGVPWYGALVTSLVFELVEDGLKRLAPGVFPVGESDTYVNSALDTTAWMIGWGVAKALPPGPKPKIWRGSGDRMRARR